MFSFTLHPIQYLLENQAVLFKGIAKILAIWHTPDGMEIRIKREDNIEEISSDGIESEINKWQNNKQGFQWLEETDLTFFINDNKAIQLKTKDLFSEIDKSILLLYIPNDMGTNDFLLLYLTPNLNHLQIGKSKDVKLSKETKPIVANMYKNFVLSTIENMKQNADFFKNNFMKHLENFSLNIEQLNAEKNDLNNRLNDMIKGLYIRHINNKGVQAISIDDSAIHKLLEFTGNLQLLESIIIDSVNFIKTIFMGELPSHLQINDYHINTIPSVQKDNTQITPQGRYDTTVEFLDNLNNTIVKLINKGERITSKLVGENMPKKISAPGITDKIKNHQPKILQLFGQYPDRWTELKRSFKPIQNIIPYKPSLLKSAV